MTPEERASDITSWDTERAPTEAFDCAMKHLREVAVEARRGERRCVAGLLRDCVEGDWIEELAAAIENGHGIGKRFSPAAEARRQGQEEMRAMCERLLKSEAEAYREHGRRCDASGNTYGGTLDAAGEAACIRIAASIRALNPSPAQEKP